MANKKLKQSEGFTIIEVLIVLAIAGLIMLIVFLAVPALQRSAHNTSIKNDVSNILGGVNEYVNNNNGTLPNKLSISGQTVTVSLSTGGTNSSTANVGYISAVKWAPGVTTPPAIGTVDVIPGVVCNATSTGVVTGTARNYVALFTLEGNAKECQQGS
jgi:prepilin-type N-terminal cleavage/methylation domain-containing protein